MKKAKKFFALRQLKPSSRVLLVFFIIVFAAVGYKYLFMGQAATSRGVAYDKLGIYPCNGDGPTQVSCYNNMAAWLGRNTSPQIPYVVLMTDGASPDMMSGNGWGTMVQAGSFQTLNPKPTIVLSVPLAFGSDGCNYSNVHTKSCFGPVANGSYDSQYQQLMQYFINGGYQNNIIIRLGWEYDGDWMPWASMRDYEGFKSAYRHVHDVLKAKIPSLKFDLEGDPLPDNYPGIGGSLTTHWTNSYPGDQYVDILGLDVYAGTNYTWPSLQERLQTGLNYAKQHGKTVSFPEWGLKKPDDPTFIQNMHDWFNSLPSSGAGSLEYQSYFNQDTTDTEGANGALFLINPYSSQTVLPQSAAKFKELFGGSTFGTATAPPPTTSLSDLVVTDVSWTPGSPIDGNSVTFKATVKNQGAAATPAGTIIGVAFGVDGNRTVTWSDTNTSSLAPGASVTLTANSGPSGSAVWLTSTAGTYVLEARVDDPSEVDRITESDETNNRLATNLPVTAPASDTIAPSVPASIT